MWWETDSFLSEPTTSDTSVSALFEIEVLKAVQDYRRVMCGYDVVTYSCCYSLCKGFIALSKEVDASLRKTGQNFFCSAGHVQSFPKSFATVEKKPELKVEIDDNATMDVSK